MNKDTLALHLAKEHPGVATSKEHIALHTGENEAPHPHTWRCGSCRKSIDNCTCPTTFNWYIWS